MSADGRGNLYSSIHMPVINAPTLCSGGFLAVFIHEFHPEFVLGSQQNYHMWTNTDPLKIALQF